MLQNLIEKDNVAILIPWKDITVDRKEMKPVNPAAYPKLVDWFLLTNLFDIRNVSSWSAANDDTVSLNLSNVWWIVFLASFL